MDATRPAIGVVLDRDLALAVRTQERQRPVPADLGQAARDAVGEHDRGRHHLVGLVDGIAEHHSLVAGAGLASSPARLQGMIDALRDVRGLTP